MRKPRTSKSRINLPAAVDPTPTTISAATANVMQVVEACVKQRLVDAQLGNLVSQDGEVTAALARVTTVPNLVAATAADFQALAMLDAGGNVASTVARLMIGEAARLRMEEARLDSGEAYLKTKAEIAVWIGRSERSLETYVKAARNVGAVEWSRRDLGGFDLLSAARQGWVEFARRAAQEAPRERGREPKDPTDRQAFAPYQKRLDTLSRDLSQLVSERKQLALAAVEVAASTTATVLLAIADPADRQAAGEVAVQAIRKAMAMDVR